MYNYYLIIRYINKSYGERWLQVTKSKQWGLGTASHKLRRGEREKVEFCCHRMVSRANLQKQTSFLFCKVILKNIPKPHNHSVVVMVTTIVARVFPRQQQHTICTHPLGSELVHLKSSTSTSTWSPDISLWSSGGEK